DLGCGSRRTYRSALANARCRDAGCDQGSARVGAVGDARRLRRAAFDSRLARLGRGRWADRAKARGKQAPVRSALVGPPSYWLIAICSSKTFRSFWFRAVG